jgi:hypothetical protein
LSFFSSEKILFKKFIHLSENSAETTGYPNAKELTQDESKT